MGAQQTELRRSKRAFMQWPIEWLWIAVIVAVALLVLVGLMVDTGAPRYERRDVPAPAISEPPRQDRSLPTAPA
jgi:hypothetical protein